MKTMKLLLCLLIMLAMSCKKEKTDPGTDNGNQPTDIPPTSQPMKVAFPDGVQADWADYNLFSLANEANLDAAGNVKAAYNKNHTHIAWLFDKDDKPVMAGFVNDTIKTLDVASTAKVLLFFAFAMPMTPDEMQQEFINGIEKIPGVADWINTFTGILRNDKLTLSTGSYLTALRSAVEGMAGDAIASATPDGREKLMGVGNANLTAIKQAEVNIVAGAQEKSGLTVSSEELSKVIISNRHRRRAHAFFYKTKFKDLDGVQKNILSEIGENTPSDKDEGISPVEALTSFTGAIGIWIEGKAMDFISKSTDPPLDFPLQDHELEATYKARIVGPGQWVAGKKPTEAERQKIFRLELETVAMDFLIPAIASSLFANASLKAGPDASPAQVQNIQALTASIAGVAEEMVNAVPGMYEDMQKGQYAAATRKVLEAIYSGNVNSTKEGFVKIMAILSKNAVDQGFYVSPQFDEVQAQKRMMGILEATDKILQASDYFRIAWALDQSNNIEEWDVQLRSGKVTLLFDTGQKSVINTAEVTRIKAEIRNMEETGGDQHPYFEWRTTGKFGKLADTKGHSGNEFATADHIVSYQSTTKSSDLDDGDNIDSVFVRALFNNILIDIDTITVTVKKVGYEIKPDDAVVTAMEHATIPREVTLHLEGNTNGERNIPNHPDLDFRVEWSTEGDYGELVGNTITYNDDDIVYKATNDRLGTFTDSVTAMIYVRRKGETEYFFYGQVKGAVEINNDPELEYEIDPGDAVVTGRKHSDAANNVTLYLEHKTTGTRPISGHPDLDFKVEWSAGGTMGEFVGNTTTYNDDDIVYKATDDRPGIFQETITAKVYARPKGETEYTYYGQVSQTVEINNDPKKIIIWAPMQMYHGDSQEPWTHGNTLHLCILENGVTFSQHPDAVSYSLQFMDMNIVIGAPKGHSWKAGDPSPYPPNEITGAYGNTGTTYTVIYAWGSRNSYDGTHVEENRFLNSRGGARIIITLK